MDDNVKAVEDPISHGAHVLGLPQEMLLNHLQTGEIFRGVAPEAQLMLCSVFSDTKGGQVQNFYLYQGCGRR